MSGTESTLPMDWFTQGDQDIQAAEILLTQGGPLSIVAFHLQQTVEKYLKGFLISRGWTLRHIHDLEILIHEAVAQDQDFVPFLAFCQRVTEYYIETRYPIGVHTPLQRESLEADLGVVRELIGVIRHKVAM